MKLQYFVLSVAAVLLTACGGGGGGGGGSTTTPTSLADVTVPANFTWATTAAVGDVKVTVSRDSGSLGSVQVWISNIQETDPVNPSVTLAEPMRAGLIASALATNTSGSSARADFGTLTLPTATTKLLVEVLDPSNIPGARVAYKAVTPAELAAGIHLSF